MTNKGSKKVWGIILIVALIIGICILMVKCNSDQEPDPVPTDTTDVIVTILDATSVYGQPLWDDFDFIYEVKNEGVNISKEELKTHLTFEKEEGEDAGTYAITGTKAEELKLNVEIIPGKYTITKATYDMSNVHFDDKVVEFDGKPHSIKVSGLIPDGVKVEYENNEVTEAGTYTVIAHFKGDEKNYNSIPDMKAELTIISLEEPKDDNQSEAGNSTKKPEPTPGKDESKDPTPTPSQGDYDLVIQIHTLYSYYGEPIKALDFDYLILNKELSFTKEELRKIIHLKKEPGRNVGSYLITGECSRKDLKVKFVLTHYYIVKANYDMSKVRFENQTVTYDGKAHSLFVTGQLPKGVTVTYEGNGQTEVGRYRVVAHFNGDMFNYRPIPDMIAYLTIEKEGGNEPDPGPGPKPTKQYTITFVDYDGTTLHTAKVNEGEMPTCPVRPTRPSANGKVYTFIGWTPEVVVATKDATYTATYKEENQKPEPTKQYTITFVNYDGTTLHTATVNEGEMPTCPVRPTRPNANGKVYTFIGWTPKVVAATKDATYTATYKEENEQPQPTKQYTITFVNYDGKVLHTAKVNEGEKPTCPVKPTRPNANGKVYTFIGWTPEVVAATKDATYTATYKEENEQPQPTKQYTITFINYDGTTLHTAKVNEGEKPTCPVTPTRPSANGKVYTFIGWTPEVVVATKDATYKATYKEEDQKPEPPKQYTVTFLDDDGTTVLRTETLAAGASITQFNPGDKTVGNVKYIFNGWENWPADGKVTGNLTLVAKYKKDNSGNQGTEGGDPDKTKYTITFLDNDGKTVLATYTLEKGANIPQHNPGDKTVGGVKYIFNGWENWPTDGKVTGNLNLTAKYKEDNSGNQGTEGSGTGKTKYTITFQYLDDAGKTVEQTYTIEEGQPMPQFAPGDRTENGKKYVFNGWENWVNGATVTGNATFVAKYKEDNSGNQGTEGSGTGKTKYTITFQYLNDAGQTVEQTYTIEEGQPMPTFAPGDRTEGGTKYVFNGWEGWVNGATVTGNATFVAKYKEDTSGNQGTEGSGTGKTKYTITFQYLNDAGETIEQTYTLEEGKDMPTFAPGDRTESGTKYIFNGWENWPTDGKVTGNLTLTAKYKEDTSGNQGTEGSGTSKKTHTITFQYLDDNGQTVEEIVTVAEGEEITPYYPGDRTEAGKKYSFNGWENWVEGATATESKTFVAKYKEDKSSNQGVEGAGTSTTLYTIEFVDDSGNVLRTETLALGADIPLHNPGDREESGVKYSFNGWENWPSDGKVAGDVTLVAKYKENNSDNQGVERVKVPNKNSETQQDADVTPEELAKAEEAKKQEELAKAAEEAQKAEEAKRQEELAKAAEEAKRQEELAKAEEEAQKQEELAKAEEAKRQEELAKAEEAKRQEELAKAEEVKRQEEAAIDANPPINEPQTDAKGQANAAEASSEDAIVSEPDDEDNDDESGNDEADDKGSDSDGDGTDDSTPEGDETPEE